MYMHTIYTHTHAHTHILNIHTTGMGYRVLPGCQPCILWGCLALSRKGTCT